jgi:periplasmic divalent cation tolerance protein
MDAAPLVVLTTFADAEDARRVIRELLDRRLIACGTLLPAARSVYRWKGEVTETPEVVVLLKTDGARWDDLTAAVREHHPYEIPELLALPVDRGLEGYLAWMASEVDA